MIADLLSQPEGRTLDFKREEVSMEKALQTLVAFANTAGGRLVIGVADDRTVTGVRDVKMEEERYANAIDSGISPPLFPDILPYVHDGRSVLVVRVPRQPGPFFVRREGETDGTYVRLGSTNRHADDRKREELRQMASAQAFDARPCFGATLDDIDAASLDAAFASTGRIPSGALQETLGLVLRAGDAVVPSNAAVLLFGTESARTRLFGSARFRAARFRGTTKANILDRLDPSASVLLSLDDVFAFVRRNTRLGARIDGMRRVDIPEYGPLALRETLANAAAHADYSHRGMSLNVFIYDDRLEVESPGGWPVGFGEEDFREGISRQRNKVVSDVMRRLNLAEHLGTGFERIRAESEGLGYPLPEWIEAGPILRVRLRPHPSVQPFTEPVTEDTTETRVTPAVGSPRERRAWFVDRLRAGETVNAVSIAERFGVVVRTARDDIAVLRAEGRVQFVGSPKFGHYVLASSAANSAST